jgi:hypothetical protein
LTGIVTNVPQCLPTKFVGGAYHKKSLLIWTEYLSNCMSHDQHDLKVEAKSMIHNFTVTFGAKYLTGIVTNVPPYQTFSLI